MFLRLKICLVILLCPRHLRVGQFLNHKLGLISGYIDVDDCVFDDVHYLPNDEFYKLLTRRTYE